MQLAKQAAIARGNQERANKLSTVADGLYRAATGANTSQKINASAKSVTLSQNSASGVMGQDGFQTLLNAVQSGSAAQQSTTVDKPVTQQLFSDRNQIVVSMASGGMNEMEIARQFGITRDEVRTILSLNTPQKANKVTGISEEK
jgi:DNA-binding NarL/FixJ family response regulator